MSLWEQAETYRGSLGRSDVWPYPCLREVGNASGLLPQDPPEAPWAVVWSSDCGSVLLGALGDVGMQTRAGGGAGEEWRQGGRRHKMPGVGLNTALQLV